MHSWSISDYKPFSEMGNSCEKRRIEQKKIVWPNFEEKILGGQFEGTIRAKTIGRNDIEEAAQFWRTSYPEVFGSHQEWFLFPEKYEENVVLMDDLESDRHKKKCWMPVLEDIETGNIAAAVLFTKEDKNLQIEASFFAIHPDYRKGANGNKFWIATFDFWKQLESTGAEYIVAFCETWHSITQFLITKKMGFKIAGIFPGNITRWYGENMEYRGCAVYVYKFLGDAQKYITKPEEWNLTPEVRKLWNVLEEINKESDDSIMQEYFLNSTE